MEQLSFDVEGAVAFPSLLRDEPGFQGFSTQAYEEYKDLRIARLGLAAGGTLPGTGGDGGPGSPAAGGGGIDSAGSDPMACSVRGADGACDCSCSGKACFERRKAADRLSRQESSCRLTCGKRWMECAP